MMPSMTTTSEKSLGLLDLTLEMRVPYDMLVMLDLSTGKTFKIPGTDWNIILNAANKTLSTPMPPPPVVKKCLVAGCKNYSSQGKFVGDLCMSCHDMITSGKLRNGTTFIHDMQSRLHKIIDIAT